MDNFNVYKDIQARTKGEIYIGVVGPVRESLRLSSVLWSLQCFRLWKMKA